MVAGTSEPDQAETSSSLSATLSGLSWGDIQPEPRVAENCGEGLAIVIYRPTVPLMHFILPLRMWSEASTLHCDKSSETP